MTINGLITDLRESINSDESIATLQDDRLYYHKAPRDAEFPYSVYQFGTEQMDAEPVVATTLTIDTWDFSHSADRALLISERIKQIAHRTFASEEVAFFSYRSRSTLPTGSEEVYRTSIVFDVIFADSAMEPV